MGALSLLARTPRQSVRDGDVYEPLDPGDRSEDSSYLPKTISSSSSTSYDYSKEEGEESDELGSGAREEDYLHPQSRLVPNSLRRHLTRFLLVILGLVAVTAGLASSDTVQRVASKHVLSTALGIGGSQRIANYYDPPREGALPPALSTLPESLRRITLISIWQGDARPSYLNNFFRSAALNADVADLLVVHISDDRSKCLDGAAENYGEPATFAWQNGGNIRIECLSREALLALEADYLCSEVGWSCTKAQQEQVLQRLRERLDGVNTDWKPMRGEMFRHFFIHTDNPLWGWVDMDLHLGNLAHIPFSLLSSFAITGPSIFTRSLLFMPGQMTWFNMAAPGLVGAWKNYAPLATPEAFCKSQEPLEGGYATGAIDETWLSAAYLRQDPGTAGQNLSWAFVPDVHGQDVFMPGRKFVVSGRHTLEVDAALSRREIEAILLEAEADTPDEYAGWSNRAISENASMGTGDNCTAAWFDKHAAQCVEQPELTKGDQITRIDSTHRGTIMRFASDPPGQLHWHLEPDRRPRRWQRKLFMHYQEIKRQTWWWGLPDFFIGDDNEVMEFDWKEQYVWRKGAQRQVNLWERHNTRLNEDGSSEHTKKPSSKRARSMLTASTTKTPSRMHRRQKTARKESID